MHNVPFDVAFQLDEFTRAAFAIIISQLLTGKKFNFDTMSFPERSDGS